MQDHIASNQLHSKLHGFAIAEGWCEKTIFGVSAHAVKVHSASASHVVLPDRLSILMA